LSGARVATGALTPPDVGTPAATLPHDALRERLQEAIGGSYHVERELGAGGFAVVYLVKDLNLKRHLAVKVLSPDLITSKTVLERFRREAETVAQLSHPHIVPLHFIGQKDDLLYLAMEFIDGDSLAGQIEKQGSLAADDAARIMREVASALDYAHKRGVIHRDIKPHNILIQGESGRVLVTDFGIARTAESSSLTASGMLVGTPAYLSPEQVTGSGSDHRADIYALGVMAYEMVTGQPPFSGPTPTAVLMKRLQGPPPSITKSNPAIPQPFEDVIMGCLAQNPAERFQTAGEVVRALGGATPVSAGHPTAEIVIKMRRARRRWTMYVAAGIGAVVLALAGGFVLLSPSRPATPRAPAGMVIIPAGTYTIGDDLGQVLARPKHAVTLDSFAIDSTEVTVGQYQAFATQQGLPVPWREEPDNRMPVTGLRYIDAAAFCASRGSGGRLPTEEEWEAAARGDQGFAYPWGNVGDPAAANTAEQNQNRVVPVGSFPRGATSRGLMDMVGNVWEWTQSSMSAYPGGTAPADGASYRVIRGGAYNSGEAAANAFYRGYIRPSLPADSARVFYAATGFRCVLPLAPSTR
jgi:formylglycine-generating enzyme required for sulfatase activity/tRNA A-37 threonylcarbamoyl transferase component Bud32